MLIEARAYQNFNGEINEVVELDCIHGLLRREDYKILEHYKDLTLYHVIDAEHILAYRTMIEAGEKPTSENLKKYLDSIYSHTVFNYYTDDLTALEDSPIGYLSDNFTDLFDDEGYPIVDNGERMEGSDRLSIDFNNCYVINGWTYEIIKE